MNRYSAINPAYGPSRATWLLGGAAAGLLAMYFGDQAQGRRRRALAADKLRSVAARSGGALEVASRDLGNRLHGLRAQASRMMTRNNVEVEDDILVARVRQRIGRAVSHPRAIEVKAQQGAVTLSGPVLAHEKAGLLAAVQKVLGVHRVEDSLEVHEQNDGLSSLQGAGKPRSHAHEGWPPGMRAAAVMGGGALAAYGLAGRSVMHMLSALTGFGLMARSLANAPLAQLAGLSREGRPVILSKTIHIEAAPETVFDLWSRYENFPRFMSNVREVRDLGEGRSHWVVKGPAGMQVEWNARVTESRRPHALGWASEPGATVRNSGSIRFQAEGKGTRVSVHMSYTPPNGVIGHAIAAMFNGDPKRQMDEDLLRMKQFIESGRTPHDAAQPGGAPLDTLQDIRQDTQQDTRQVGPQDGPQALPSSSTTLH